MLDLRSSTTYLLLGLLALGSWWAAEILTPEEEAPPKLTPGKVDYYSENVRRTVLGDTGQPKELLLADRMVHFENDDRTELARPVMTLYGEQGPPWVIRADSAVLPGGSDDVLLYGEVVITRSADKKGKTIRIETSNARVQPDRKFAETDEHVLMLSPPDVMTGTGARVWFGENLKFTVLEDVRRKHEVE